MSLGSYLKWDSSYTEQNETKKPFYGLLCGGFVLGLYVLGVAFGQRQQWWMRVCSNRCPCTILGDEFEFTQELRLDNQPLKTPCLSSQDQKNKLSIWFFKWRVRTGSYCTGPHLLRLPIKCYLTARYEPKTLFFSLSSTNRGSCGTVHYFLTSSQLSIASEKTPASRLKIFFCDENYSNRL